MDPPVTKPPITDHGGVARLRLRPPIPSDEVEVLAAQRELASDNFVFAFLQPEQSFAEYVQTVEDHRHGGSLADGWVPSTWLLAVVDGGVVGRSSIRFELNDSLRMKGGHIGYAVRPGHRRRGYATEILRQSLIVARAAGVDRALLTCDDDNIASSTVIEALGGRQENVIDVDGVRLRRYWID
jgi:predicted acetyltransferase